MHQSRPRCRLLGLWGGCAANVFPPPSAPARVYLSCTVLYKVRIPPEVKYFFGRAGRQPDTNCMILSPYAQVAPELTGAADPDADTDMNGDADARIGAHDSGDDDIDDEAGTEPQSSILKVVDSASTSQLPQQRLTVGLLFGLLLIAIIVVSSEDGAHGHEPQHAGDGHGSRHEWLQKFVWPPHDSCAPFFMIIGAPKCATTSMFEYLSHHPDVRPPLRKELCLFSSVATTRTVVTWDEYVHALHGRDGKVTCDEGNTRKSFEACPMYLGEQAAARGILAAFPRMLAIAMLRNPVDRTISAFHDRNPFGYLRVPGSTRARLEPTIRAQLARLSGLRAGVSYEANSSLWEDEELRLVTNGVYIYGLRQWAERMNLQSKASLARPSLLTLRLEDLKASPAATMAKVEDFLSLPHRLTSEIWATKHNAAGGHTMVREEPTPELRRLLDCFFAPHNAELYSWAEQRGAPIEPWPREDAPGCSSWG